MRDARLHPLRRVRGVQRRVAEASCIRFESLKATGSGVRCSTGLRDFPSPARVHVLFAIALVEEVARMRERRPAAPLAFLMSGRRTTELVGRHRGAGSSWHDEHLSSDHLIGCQVLASMDPARRLEEGLARSFCNPRAWNSANNARRGPARGTHSRPGSDRRRSLRVESAPCRGQVPRTSAASQFARQPGSRGRLHRRAAPLRHPARAGSLRLRDIPKPSRAFPPYVNHPGQ
jgi:hypothetical protein